jgi:competence protein ComEC
MNVDFSRNPFIIFTIATMAGILFGKFLIPFEFAFWIGCIFVILFLLNILLLKNPKLSQIILLTALFFAAAARFNAVCFFSNNHITLLDYSKIESITGKVLETKYKSDNRNKYTISVSEAEIDNLSIETNGKVLINTRKINKKYSYGDVLKIRCKLQEPKGQRNPGQFDYKNYLSGQDIHLISYINHIDSVDVLDKKVGNVFIHTIIEPVKNFFNRSINSFLSPENASILKALLLGQKQDINKDIMDRFKNVGVVHVLAISGLHVGFIILFVFIFLSFFRLKYNTKIYALLVILFIYIVLINFKAPVMRAGIMAGLYLLAKLGERKISLFNIIFFAAFLLLLIDPRDLFNPGFQFSFVAVLSIVYGYPRLNELIPLKMKLSSRNKKFKVASFSIKYIWDPFLVSLATVLGTLPLTLYYYGILPTYALLANILVIPLVGLIVILGIFLIFFALFSSLIAGSLGHLIDLLFDILKYIIALFHNLPYSHFYSTTPSVIMVLLMLILIFILFNIKIRSYRLSAVGLIVILVFLNLNKNPNSNYLEVTFLDVSQGDACFIKFPNGESMLVDGGDATKDWDQGKNTIIPFLKFNNISRIKYIVASHPHNDHIGGLAEILNTLTVDTLVISEYEFNTQKYKEIIEISNKREIPIRYIKKGNRLYPDSSCRVYILHPTEEFVEEKTFSGEECNNSSIVMKIQYGENGILLTGDTEREAEKEFMKYGDFLECEIIKLGHHGSKTSSTKQMLKFVNPLIGVISVAERNKFRLPSLVTMDRLDYNHIKPFLTSTNGAIKFQITPGKIKLINWNNNFIKLF